MAITAVKTKLLNISNFASGYDNCRSEDQTILPVAVTIAAAKAKLLKISIYAKGDGQGPCNYVEMNAIFTSR